jgi:hypothetical protein
MPTSRLRYERVEGDGYLTIDAPWVVPALLRSVPIEGRVLEPAAGRGARRRGKATLGCGSPDETSSQLDPHVRSHKILGRGPRRRIGKGGQGVAQDALRAGGPSEDV